MFFNFLEDQAAEKGSKKTKVAVGHQRVEDKYWENMGLSAESYCFDDVGIFDYYCMLKSRDSCLLGLFLPFYDEDLIVKVWTIRDWYYAPQRLLNGGQLSYKMIYKFLTIGIGIFGL
eukprot:gene7039-7784_t